MVMVIVMVMLIVMVIVMVVVMVIVMVMVMVMMIMMIQGSTRYIKTSTSFGVRRGWLKNCARYWSVAVLYWYHCQARLQEFVRLWAKITT
jgi:hypothetical protein